MNKKWWLGIILSLAAALAIGGNIYGQRSELCDMVDMKPILSLQQVTQAELMHYIVVLSGMAPPSPEGMTPEEMYRIEVQMLIDAGYPPVFAEIEPDRLATRRYFASIMYQVAVETDSEFARKYAGLTDETEQLRALVEAEWLYAEEGRIYREEILSVLCTHIVERPPIPAVDIVPEEIMEATIEYPTSLP